MIEHELLLLGLLKEGPKHGYDIKIRIKEILSLFAGINLKSIYYPLRILEKNGLIKKKISRQGRRPKRFVYELTANGEGKFLELLTRSFLDCKRPEFNLDLSLYFLGYIKPEIAIRRMRGRLQILRRISKGLKKLSFTLKNQHKNSLLSIVEHNLEMIDTEVKFLKKLINNFA